MDTTIDWNCHHDWLMVQIGTGPDLKLNKTEFLIIAIRGN